MIKFVLISLIGLVFQLHSEKHPARFDGLFGAPVESEIANFVQLASYFLPYKPVIFEIGAYEGRCTVGLAGHYIHRKKGQLFAFEPNPRAYERLGARIQGCEDVKIFNLAFSTYNGHAKLYLNRDGSSQEQFEANSSLLKRREKKKSHQDQSVQVPCFILDDWCEANGIDHIDFIRIDVSGSELQILKSSPKILKTVKIICTNTYLHSIWENTPMFAQLKYQLESMGFEMLAHWYRKGLQGEATFIRKEIYDAMYR